jgi:ribosomal protein S5
MVSIPMIGTTCHTRLRNLPGSKVRLIGRARERAWSPASRSAVLEMAGITDCLTKCYGSTNSFNTIKAVFKAGSRTSDASGLPFGAPRR